MLLKNKQQYIFFAGRWKGKIWIFCILSLLHFSCKKYLDEKPDIHLATPSTVKDLQGLLDYFNYMNLACSDAGEVASDNYYLPDAIFSSLPADGNRNAYLWKKDILVGVSNNDWVNLYRIVYNANIVLDNIEHIQKDSINSTIWDNCKGSALFFRGKTFWEIAQNWAKAYDSSTASEDLGIPLRLTSDFNTKSLRASIKESYKQIISDLESAISLLPKFASHPYRPSRAAAYGILARCYLSMRDYNNAKLYSDSCLEINNTLIDYNSLNAGSSYPFSNLQFSNSEDLFHSVCVGANSRNLRTGRGVIDSSLYMLYDINDLRKTVFFENTGNGKFYFKGSYDGATTLNYNGIATDEIYLTRAECNARKNNVNDAMNDLNTLMIKRWKNNGTFVSYAANNSTDALNLILLERRKELVYRMARWTDIKRLNKEGANIILKRILQGQIYTLAPNDSKYALPIPDNVIQISGMPQN